MCASLRFFSESVDQYRKQIFILLFQRLQNSKTTKFIKSKHIIWKCFETKYFKTVVVSKSLISQKCLK